MPGVLGLHHVTAISGAARENLDFYTRTLGMRLVKKSVNQDDPGTYHLFYADADGSPGTDLTFFPWPQLVPVSPGHGLAPDAAHGTARKPDFCAVSVRRCGREERFGERTLLLRDPHGQPLALVAGEPADCPAAVGTESAAEMQVTGFHGARIVVRDPGPTTALLTVLGYREIATENGWHRFAVGDGGSGRFLDLTAAPDAPRGRTGTGGIHHLAFRVTDDAHELAVRDAVIAAGRRPTPVIDRFWFRSVYFREPGGVLFELATDGPGFAVDEDPATWRTARAPPLEPERAAIEAALRLSTVDAAGNVSR